MPPTLKEARVILAIKAIWNDLKLSIQAIAKIYNITSRTIHRRLANIPIQYDILANSHSLTDLEEKAIVQFIIELYTRAFPPRLYSIEDIANYL